MTGTLLIRLEAPMQAWGVQSKFSMRDTCREPTKSGVIGLLCCALGRQRSENLEDLVDLRMGVRVDREGMLMKDFQTARNIMNAKGSPDTNVISDRYFLADAVFLVGLEGKNEEQLHTLLHALQHPRWLLYLGRRAFPPSKPVWLPDGLRLGIDLQRALAEYPFLCGEATYQKSEQLRVLLEDPQGGVTQRDIPQPFSSRSFSPRSVLVLSIRKPASVLEEGKDVS
ncbi:MAG: type I-E CRISPR-associated protein Cas5/CasD [Pelolinea sp.]|jgi:CRISPR system Cascade subunit CasD|nr:type I-E CRISPR-associated protein Cas5/CasD [Pelolinea sp.]